MDPVERSKIPSGHEMVVPYTNHSELQHINDLARAAGITNLPFQDVETLVEDTGERFFSEYFHWHKETKPGNDPKIDCCLCIDCNPSAAAPTPTAAIADTPTPTAAVANTPAPTATVAPPPVVPPPVVPPPRAAPIAPPAAAIPIAPIPPPPVHQPQYYPQHPQYQQFYLMQQMMQPQTFSKCQPPQFCCNKYRKNRMEGNTGKPPHDHGCRSRSKNNNI